MRAYTTIRAAEAEGLSRLIWIATLTFLIAALSPLECRADVWQPTSVPGIMYYNSACIATGYTDSGVADAWQWQYDVQNFNTSTTSFQYSFSDHPERGWTAISLNGTAATQVGAHVILIDYNTTIDCSQKPGPIMFQ